MSCRQAPRSSKCTWKYRRGFGKALYGNSPEIKEVTGLSFSFLFSNRNREVFHEDSQEHAGVTLAVVLLLAFVLCSVPGPAQDQKQPIVFALIEPLSGPFKDVGTEVGAYVEYGVEQLNAAGGLLGRPVKLVQYDNQMKPDIAVRMGRKAVTRRRRKGHYEPHEQRCRPCPCQARKGIECHPPHPS